MAGKPLPAAKDDPLIQAGYAAKDEYTSTLQAIRSDHDLSTLGQAERIDAAWRKLRTTLVDLQDRFYVQRRARMETLEAQIPMGPNIPPDTNRADAVVLHQAFNAAFTTALNATPAELEVMFSNAERFDDDISRRAVLTAASDRGHGNIINRWASGNPDRIAGLREMEGLRQLAAGRGTDAGFARQAFDGMGVIKQPPESTQLEVIRERAANSR